MSDTARDTLATRCRTVREDLGVGIAGGAPCRASGPLAHVDHRTGAVAAVLGGVGFAGTLRHLGASPDFGGLEDTVSFGLWSALLSALVGFAVGSAVVTSIRLRMTLRVGGRRPTVGEVAVRTLGVVGVLGAVLGALVANTHLGPEGVSNDLNRHTWPISALVGACAVPGLLSMLTIGWIAGDDVQWEETHRCQARLVTRLRGEVRWTLAALGALLTLLVITAGVRRRTLLAFDPGLDEPIEGVLMYGLLFAVLLAGFYGVAARAIEARVGSIVEQLAPFPDPAADDLHDQLARRQDVETLLGAGGTWRSFETVVVIAAPLLTALIGTATSG